MRPALCLFFVQAFRSVAVSTLTTDHSIHDSDCNVDFQDMEEGYLEVLGKQVDRVMKPNQLTRWANPHD